LPKVRVRHHVNPLSKKYLTPITPPSWETIYGNLTQPLHLDIGCGWGEFLLEMAQSRPQWNFLGLEIREPLVESANQQRDELGLDNLHYLFSNVNVDLPCLLSSLPFGCLQYVTIQFPDPWFKKRHAKRRTVQPRLVETLAQGMPDGSWILLQSDVEFVAVQMRDRFQASPAFQRQHEEPWLASNPLPVPTERELMTRSRDQPVYRCLFRAIRPGTTS